MREDQVAIAALRARLRNMDDAALERFGRDAALMCRTELDGEQHPQLKVVTQIVEVWAELRRRRTLPIDPYVSGHISDHDLERYYLGMVTEEAELAPLEEHLLWCNSCVGRAEETQDYVDIMRRALILGGHDLTR